MLTHTFCYKHTHSLLFVCLSLFLEPCVPPSPPSLLVCLPSSFPVSSSPRAVQERRICSSPPPPAGRAQEERMGAHSLSSLSLPLALSLSPSPVSSQGDGGAALLAVEEVRGSPGSSHSAAVCCFTVVRLHPSLPHSLCVCVCVCQSCLPLSSPLIDSSFCLPFVSALSASLSLHPLVSCSFLLFPLSRFSFCASPRLLHQLG